MQLALLATGLAPNLIP